MEGLIVVLRITNSEYLHISMADETKLHTLIEIDFQKRSFHIFFWLILNIKQHKIVALITYYYDLNTKINIVRPIDNLLFDVK